MMRPQTHHGEFQTMTPRNYPEAQDSNNRTPSYSILAGISLAFHGVNECKMLKRTEQETVKN
jgi:hypothetical protein